MKRCRIFLSRVAQSTMDYLILTAVVLVVIVPLLFLSASRLSGAGISELTESVNTIRGGILTISNLGYGAATRVVVYIPKGITEQAVRSGYLYYIINNQKVSISVPAELKGILPMNEGQHFINLFNDGKHIWIYECGNNNLEPFEQCEESITGVCGSGICIPPESPAGACRCYCDPNAGSNQCGGSSCSIVQGGSYCAPCIDDSECGSGNICYQGNCVLNICAPGQQPCGIGPNLQPASCCDSTKNEVCINNQCMLSSNKCLNVQCSAGETCNPTTGTCEPPTTVCGDGTINPPEVCDFDALGNSIGCTSPATCSSNCLSCEPPPSQCQPGLLCMSGGYTYVCDPTGECNPCDDLTNPCPAGYVCQANGQCQLPPQNLNCGNNALELQYGEQCEYSSIASNNFIGACPAETPACNTATCLCGGTPQTSPYCGNGLVEAGEVCDEGSNNGVAGTKSNICGIRKSGPVCGLNCKCQAPNNGAYCGNEQLNPPGEGCDPTYSGGCANGGLCLNSCACSGKPQCGNRAIEPGEMCDGSTQGCFFGEGIETACVDCVCTYYKLPPPPPPPPPPLCSIPEGVSCVTAAECTAPAPPGTSWECTSNCCILVQVWFV